MVEPFCGLSLWFVAYDEKDLTEMKEKTIENSMFYIPLFIANFMLTSLIFREMIEYLEKMNSGKKIISQLKM